MKDDTKRLDEIQQTTRQWAEDSIALNDIRATIAVNLQRGLIPASINEPDTIEGKVFAALEMSAEIDRLKRQVEAASELAGWLNGQDRDERKCPICGAVHGEPHFQGCALENYCRLAREGG